MIVPLPYLPDSCDYFSRMRTLPGAVFLDSARPWSPRGRFDLMSALPRLQLVTQADVTRVENADGRTETFAEPPFAVLERILEQSRPPALPPVGEWPFSGGAIGLFGYGLGRRIAGLSARTDPMLPDMCVGIHDWALMQDHDRRRAAVLFTVRCSVRERERVMSLLTEPASAAGPMLHRTGPWVPTLDHAGYRTAFERAQEYIRAGDCYQINLAQHHSAPVCGDPWSAYRELRQKMGSPFSGYMSFGGSTVLSFSPERFLHVAGGRVETRPIKGTVKRGRSGAADRRAVTQLLGSEKDRAENVMIVDLMRNDLGTACRIGSVHVEQLCALETYANVHHLVSSVTGQLPEGTSPARLLGNCFPGGSITGAPKIRAMQIIDELEPVPRSAYCGSLGYLSYDGVMDTSITIRTLVCDGSRLHAWGGGGLVADSDCESEYRECLTKIAPLLHGIEEDRRTTVA